MAKKNPTIKTALVSVYDKTGLIPFVKGLIQRNIQIISTGNTARTLREAGIRVTEVSEITRFPEMLDGRVKTLHPRIHGGILARRDKPEHLATLAKQQIPLIDLVVIHLYPFEEALEKDLSDEKMIEMIDIGGPTMLRAAAKNYESVTVICDRADYDSFLRVFDEQGGKPDRDYRKALAAKVFGRTSRYDEQITAYLHRSRPKAKRSRILPHEFAARYRKVHDLRYGENPHQASAVYTSLADDGPGLTEALVLGGKELSFNNYLDLEAAWSIVSAFKESCVCVVKHNNPCGFAVRKNITEAFRLAFEGDPLSAFGGIVGLNRAVNTATARAMVDAGFLECIVAPGFHDGALQVLRKKKNLRLVQMPRKQFRADWDFKKITGGLLVQDANLKDAASKDLKVVTRKRPTAGQLEDLLLGFKLLKFVKSNAIVLVKNKQAVGFGMGQPSRVDSVMSAIQKAGKRSGGAVLASDGFFPKPDSIQKAAKHGIRAVIQPGGSIQDQSIIKACHQAKISMVFTGIRHFTH